MTFLLPSGIKGLRIPSLHNTSKRLLLYRGKAEIPQASKVRTLLVNYCYKALHLRYLRESWLRHCSRSLDECFWLNKLNFCFVWRKLNFTWVLCPYFYAAFLWTLWQYCNIKKQPSHTWQACFNKNDTRKPYKTTENV